MGTILIRNVADATKAGLKKKAKTAGKSLDDIAREALDAAAKPSKAEIGAEAYRIRAKIRAKLVMTSSTPLPASGKIATPVKRTIRGFSSLTPASRSNGCSPKPAPTAPPRSGQRIPI